MKKLKTYLGIGILIVCFVFSGCSSNNDSVKDTKESGGQIAESQSEAEETVVETVAETKVTDTLEELTDLIYAEKQNIIDRFGEPNEVILHESEMDPMYNYNELIYDDLIFWTDAGGEHEAVNYIKITTTDNKYSFYGIYLGMPKDELINDLDGRLTLYTDMEFTEDPFDDGDVTYRILNYDAFAMIKLENDVVTQIEYLFPIV